MNLVVVSIKDEKTGAFSQPSFVPTVGAAVRSFSELCNTKDSMCCKYPQDFTMYKIGTFDDELGFFNPLMVTIEDGAAPIFQPEVIARAVDYVSVEN